MRPRLGDVYDDIEKFETRRQHYATGRILRAETEQSDILDLRRCSLRRCPEELSSDALCAQLTHIDLSKNELYSNNGLNGPLAPSAGDLCSLEEIHLDGNTITALPSTIGRWSRLRIFIAANNRISTLPDTSKNWSMLESLDLRNNGISTIPLECLVGWHQLKQLLLSNNKFSSLPEVWNNFPELQTLDLRANTLVTLPLGLESCGQLRMLNVANNKVRATGQHLCIGDHSTQITALPANVCQGLTNLQELYLFKNKIDSIPPEIRCLTACQVLSLSSNNLRDLPEEIGELVNLRELYLNNNAKFHGLPASAGSLSNLQELEMRKCPALKSLPSSAAQLPSLRELDVRAPKKQVCKITPEMADALASRQCTIRGGIIRVLKKGRGKHKTK